MIYSIIVFLELQIQILFSFKKKIFILAQPIHSNLGDQAQLLCTDDWLKINYPKYKIIHLGYFMPTLNLPPYKYVFFDIIKTYITLFNLKFRINSRDIFIGHSGYFMTDHHIGWTTFMTIAHYFPNNKFIIFPQTINFYNPYIKLQISKAFNIHSKITLMCRDEISYENAKILFPNVRLILYPDIVTLLIGQNVYNNKKEGVLFCIRNDVEAYYSKSEIDHLMNLFKVEKIEKTDTSIQISRKELDKNRRKLIYQMIDNFSNFKVIITDRYHGTIFSLIANTPVIVLASADHKLSSGVNWFPDSFKEYVHFANNLDEAYKIACNILQKENTNNTLPAYFKSNYYDNLKQKLS